MFAHSRVQQWRVVAAHETKGGEPLGHQVVDILRAQLAPSTGAHASGQRGRVRFPVQALSERVQQWRDLYDLAVSASGEPGALFERRSVELAEQLDTIGEPPTPRGRIGSRIGVQLRRAHKAAPASRNNAGGGAST